MPHEPDMRDPKDKELHTKEGVEPYPVPNKSKVVGAPQDDDTTPTGKDFERGKDKDGEYEGGVDRMRNTLKNQGVKDAWSEGRTQGAPDKKL